VPIENATAELHSARLRHQRDLAERTRFRRLVERVDEVIEVCEETHLQGIKEAPRELAQQSGEVLQNAIGIVEGAGDENAVRVVTDAVARRQVKVTEIMDVLWTVQEVVFDLMLPWRSQLPEDVEVAGAATGIWRYDSAA
jgi:phage terminase large subunit-like protein